VRKKRLNSELSAGERPAMLLMLWTPGTGKIVRTGTASWCGGGELVVFQEKLFLEKEID